MAHPRICVAGSLNMDLVVQTPSLPLPGQTLLGGPFSTFPGGKGANQAVAAARAGGQVSMVGCVGDDAYGAALQNGLDAEGVGSTYILRRTGVSSGVALIAVAPDGQNTIIVAPGANATLTAEDIERAGAAIAAADVLLLQLEVPIPAIVRAATLAREAGTIVILNPAPAQVLDPTVLRTVDFIVPNETEAELLAGIAPADPAMATAAARKLQAFGVRSVVVTLGSRGALLLHEERVTHQRAYPVNAIDATAAGDAFLGAFAVALAEGLAPSNALRWGAAAGALATTRAGAQPSLPSRNAIQALLDASHASEHSH